MQRGVVIGLTVCHKLNGIKGLVLGVEHVARHGDIDLLAALEPVAREVFTLIRPGRGIDVELGHNAVHRILEQIGAGRLDFTGGFRLALPDQSVGIMLCLGKGGERAAQQYHHCQQNSAGRFQKTCIFHGASS